MKRTCKRRKAMREVGVVTYECEFGYKTNGFAKPLEECPKPTTYDEYIKVINEENTRRLKRSYIN